ncbi:hypothetical protein N9023_02015 [Opitutaceae bacterium]|nr:hypothetical protein [Opitutaceae bacterium]
MLSSVLPSSSASALPSAHSLQTETRGQSEPTAYRVRELAPPHPGYGFRPTAINEQGQIIGNRIDPLRFEGASVSATGQILPEITLTNDAPTRAERALPYAALSSNGLVAGTVGTPAGLRGAWASHLGAFGRELWPDNLSFAQGINAAGTVVGKMLLTATPLLVARAFLVTADGQPTHFAPPDGGLPDAIDINDAGTVLLNVTPLSIGAESPRAWLWREGNFIALPVPFGATSTAIALNGKGHVVGYIENEFGVRRPTLWIDQEPLDLETTMTADFIPTCINDDLMIGGSAINLCNQRRACVWSPREGLQFLQEHETARRETQLETVVDLTDSGRALAMLTVDNQPRGFLLEPSA